MEAGPGRLSFLRGPGVEALPRQPGPVLSRASGPLPTPGAPAPTPENCVSSLIRYGPTRLHKCFRKELC